MLVILMFLPDFSHAEYVNVPVTSIRAFRVPIQAKNCGYRKVYYYDNGEARYKMVKHCQNKTSYRSGFLCCAVHKDKNICQAFDRPVKYLRIWDDHGYPDR